MKKHSGSCICGDVQFEATLDASKGGQCNCTICTKYHPVGTIIKPEAFAVTKGEDKLSTFSRFPQYGQRYFCSRCHTYLFGKGDIPEIGGAFVSVNLNTLDDIDLADVTITHVDGRHDNWMAGPRPSRWPLSPRGGDALPGGTSA